ncbi:MULTISPECIES: SsgA family sporulation/cell division regulator [Streptomyces]|uniref:SsgA family sporulation/cell division regulator n=1 Tax=Streptomyces TaxID=1883 RepID=UPI00067D551D|nr:MULTISPECIES: SsgA family sporulation/cell division regulator [Streptomyces]
MFILPAFRRRLARVVALLGPSAPQPPALRADIGHQDPDPASVCPQRRPVDVSGHPGALPARLPALVHGGEQTWIPVVMDLRYDRDDPLAVDFTFHGPTGALARWRFSRDLLLAGLDELVGQGEVMIWPSDEGPADSVLFLRLGLQERHALLAVRREPVHEWLAGTLAAVPLGDELAGTDWDEEQRRLLRTA